MKQHGKPNKQYTSINHPVYHPFHHHMFMAGLPHQKPLNIRDAFVDGIWSPRNRCDVKKQRFFRRLPWRCFEDLDSRCFNKLIECFEIR